MIKQLCKVVLPFLLTFNSYSMIQTKSGEDGSFGVGNGGDGVVIEVPIYENTEFMSPDPTWDYDVILEFNKLINESPKKLDEYGNEIIDEDKIPYILGSFLLDFAELGIEHKAKVELCHYTSPQDELFKLNHSINISYSGNFEQGYTKRCFVNDYNFFQELMEYEGFFGEIRNLSLYDFSRERVRFENTNMELSIISRNILRLKIEAEEKFDQYKKLKDQYRVCAAAGQDENHCLLIEEQREEQYELYSSKNQEYYRAANTFNEVAFRYFPNVTKGTYNARTYIALGIIDKIEQIERADHDFAQKVKETLLSLEWELLDFPLKEINDEGTIIPTITTKYQIATRHYGIVRITNSGWNKSFEYDGKTVYPLTVENKIGLIFHEVFSQIRQEMGDNTSERARYATTYLFKSNKSKRYINKVISLMTEK